MRSVYLELAMWQRSCAVLMNLVEWSMAEQHNQTTANILTGVRELFEENRKHRVAELAPIHDRISYIAQQVEEMRATHAGNLERLSDRMHEMREVHAGEYRKQYTQLVMELEGLKERLSDLEKLVYEMANYLPQPTEASSEQQ